MAGIFLPGASKGGDITGVTAGVGLSGGGDSSGVTLTLDLSELSAVVPTSGDWFGTLDSDEANEQLTTTDALATLFAGDGLTASSAALSVNVDDSTIETDSDAIRIKDDGVTAAKLFNLARGSVLIGNASAATAELTIGNNTYVLTSDGTDIAWAAAGSGASLSGSTNNTVATVTGANALAGEANLTFDGSTLAVTGAVTVSTDLTVSGGDIVYGNGQNATASVTATAHDAAGRNLTITAGPTTAGTSNNQAGGALTLQGGQGKGTGAGGDIIFQTSNPATSAASTLNSYTTALTIESSVSSGSQVVIPDGGSIRFDEHTGNAEDPGTDHTAHGLIFSFQSSGARDFGDVLYIGANGEVGNADADLAYAPAIGISVNAAQSVDHGPIDVLTHGIARDDSWNWTKGGTLYVSTTSGELTQTKPSGDGDYVQIMGEALTDVSIFIMPSLTYVTVDA